MPMRDTQENTKTERDKDWIFHSGFTIRQDDVGRCAEEKGGTPDCAPGMCEMCCNCSFMTNMPNKKSN